VHAVMVTRNLFWCPRCQPEPSDAVLGAGAELSVPVADPAVAGADDDEDE